MRRSSVLLPQPLGPISDTNSPGATVRSTDSRAVTDAPLRPPNVRLTARTSTAWLMSFMPGSPNVDRA